MLRPMYWPKVNIEVTNAGRKVKISNISRKANITSENVRNYDQ